jgi:hypothetical protein
VVTDQARVDTRNKRISDLRERLKVGGNAANAAVQAGYGAAIMEEKSGEWALAITSQNASSRERVLKEITVERDRMLNASGGLAGLKDGARGRYDFLTDSLATGDAIRETAGFTKVLSEAEEKAFADTHDGRSTRDMLGAASLLHDRGDVRTGQALQETARFNKETGENWLKQLKEGGTLGEEDKLTKGASARLRAASLGISKERAEALVARGGGSKSDAETFVESFRDEARKRADMSLHPEDVEGNKKLLQEADALRAGREDMSAGWDQGKRKRMAQALGATPGMEGESGRIAGEDALGKKLGKYGIAGAGVGTGGRDAKELLKLSKALGGSGVTMEQLQGLDTEGQANLIAKSIGQEGQGKVLLEALKQSQSGDESTRNKGISTLSKAEQAGQQAKSAAAAANDPTVQAIKAAMAEAFKGGIGLKDGTSVKVSNLADIKKL